MPETQKRIARRISITGVVQGVGFRPFVYNLAREKGLAGWVLNHSGGVDIEVEGPEAALEAFVIDLKTKAPPLAGIESLEARPIPPQDLGPFEIRPSLSQEGRYQLISPDVATCPDCLRELLDPKDRRYRYPFINCTNCGPRFTIIEEIPYDRPKTTMRVFPMCDDCLAEYEDPGNRRFHAQPNACPVCGPQVWLVEQARKRESEKAKRRESDGERKPAIDQTIAPIEAAVSATGNRQPATGNRHPTSNIQHPTSDPVFARARELLLAGKILAIKGLGGFHLACDATNPEAVEALRERKRRPHKPFAVMVATLDDVRTLCAVPEEAKTLLTSPQSPIVLLDAKDDTPIAPNVAPNSHTLGVMIPTTPLHHILLRDVGLPLVMTSGNVTEEPIAKDNDEALRRLAPLADAFLLHNRDIHARYDDSVVQVVGEWKNQRITESANERASEQAKTRKGDRIWHRVSKVSAIEDRPQRDASIQQPVLSLPKDPASTIQLPASSFTVPARRARGYAPFPIRLPFTVPQIFAAGPLLKNTFTLTRDHYAFVSQHIGDLENLDTLEHYETALATYQHLFRIEPKIVVSDLHPDYLSTRLAETFAREHHLPSPYRVQHHHAHIAACLADCGWSPDAASPDSESADAAPADAEPIIGVALDGTGYGEDGHIWGGEWFVGDYRGFERVAHLAYLPLPGGDAAIRHPWRIAVAYLHALELDGSMPLGEFCPADVMRVRTMVDRRLNTPLTSSMGRLFDAVSALLGICHEATYEAQAAMELEQIAGRHSGAVAAPHRITPYPFALDTGTSPYQIQVETLLDAILEDVARAEPTALIAQRFHMTIAAMIVTVCERLRADRGLNVVALSGGVFQNRLLTALTLSQLTASGFEVLYHQQVPPNDGGISLGQAVMASFAHS